MNRQNFFRTAYIKNDVHVNWALPHILLENVAKKMKK